MTSLRQRATSAAIWSGADVVLRQGLQFAVAVVLARLLSPEEFGTIALLYLFTGVAGVFVDSGFSAALIQKQDVTKVDESTVFWFNLLMGGITAFLLFLAAPWIAGFYELPIVEPLAWVMAANIFVTALGAIQSTLLTKQLDFRTQMKVGIFASIASSIIAIWMAAKGYGVWALAAQVLVASMCTTLLLWVLSPWRPGGVFSFYSARRLFGFGSYMMASGMLDMVYSRLYTVFVGKMFGVRELGFYNRADGTKQVPVGVLTGILSRVAFPAFSQVADSAVRLRRGVRLSVRMMMLANVPAMLGLIAVAEPLVLTLFGEDWLPVAPLLQVLCLAGIFWPLHVINLNVLMAQGHSSLFFRLEVIKKVIGVVLLLVAFPYGTMAIAWSTVAFGAVAFIINAYYSGKFLDYGAWSQAKDTFPILMISIAMNLATAWANGHWTAAPLVKLAGLTGFGTVVFIVLAGLFRLQALDDVWKLVRTGGYDRE